MTLDEAMKMYDRLCAEDEKKFVWQRGCLCCYKTDDPLVFQIMKNGVEWVGLHIGQTDLTIKRGL